MAKFASMKEAIERGKVAKLTRLDTGVPNMVKLLPRIAGSAQSVPLWFLALKGAWESNGIPTTTSKSQKDVGLFQIIIKPGEKLQGYTWAQFKDPKVNTKVFAGRVNAWKASLAKQFGAKYFPEGMDSDQVWGIIWLFGGIGSHATRHILKEIGPGPRSFDRIVGFALKNSKWFEAKEQQSHWGVQDGPLVVFRILIGKRVIEYGIAMRDKIDAFKKGARAAAPFLGLGVGAVGMIATVVIAGLILWARKRKAARLAGPRQQKPRQIAGTPTESPTALTSGGEQGRRESPKDLEDHGIEAPIEFGDVGADALGAIEGGDVAHFDDTVDIDIDEEILADGFSCPANVPKEICAEIERAREYMRREKVEMMRLRCGLDMGGKYVCIKAVEK